MKSVKFTETIQIRECPGVIFDYTQDYGNRLKWDTFLRRADLVDGATVAGKGVKSYCVAKNGIGTETVYVSGRLPGQAHPATQRTAAPRGFKDVHRTQSPSRRSRRCRALSRSLILNDGFSVMNKAINSLSTIQLQFIIQNL
jgi:hypothetical protein